MEKQNYDDEILIQYLLGSLTEETSECLDELSIADDEMASRLLVIENDLVDAYIKGGLSGRTLERFESFYLATPKRREKVGFARTFLTSGERTAGAQTTSARNNPVADVPRSAGGAGVRGSLRRFFVPLQWGFAAAALVLLLGGGYLMVENLRLRDQMAQAQAERGALEQRERELQRQLADQRSADAETEKELSRVRDRLVQLEQAAGDEQNGNTNKSVLKLIAFNLAPQTRGIAQIPTFAVPPGTDFVVFNLELETPEFPSFQASLKNPANRQTLWRSGKLTASGTSTTLPVRMRATLLNAQNYLVELSGVSGSGAAEIVGSYPFRVVKQ